MLFPCTRARAHACRRRLLGELAAIDGLPITEPLGYVEFSALALPGARRPDRLRRRPEGGVPCRGALRDAASEHRVGGDGAGGVEHARRPRRRAPRSPRWSMRRRRERPAAVRRRPRGRALRDRDQRAAATRTVSDERADGRARGRRRPRLLGAEPRAELRRDRRLRAGLAVRRVERGARQAGASRSPAPAPRPSSRTCSTDPELDAIVLATPVPTHAELAIARRPGRQALLRGEAARDHRRRRRTRRRAAEQAGQDPDGRPPARVPPGGRSAEGADRRRGARSSSTTSTATA